MTVTLNHENIIILKYKSCRGVICTVICSKYELFLKIYNFNKAKQIAYMSVFAVTDLQSFVCDLTD